MQPRLFSRRPKGRPLPRRPRRRQPHYPGADFALTRRPHEEIKSSTLSGLGTAYYDGAGAGAFLLDISNIAQGISGAQRAGDHLHLQHIMLRFSIYNQTGAGANVAVNSRIFVYQYFGDNTAGLAKPILSDFLQISNANAGNTYGTFSSFDIDYDRQYRILYDSSVITTYGAPAAFSSTNIGVSQARFVNIPLARADRDIAFYTGTIYGPNHVFLAITSDTATAASNPQFTYATEVRFTDS